MIEPSTKQNENKALINGKLIDYDIASLRRKAPEYRKDWPYLGCGCVCRKDGRILSLDLLHFWARPGDAHSMNAFESIDLRADW